MGAWKLSAFAVQLVVSLKLLQNIEYILKIKHISCTDAKLTYLYDVNSTMCEQVQLPVCEGSRKLRIWLSEAVFQVTPLVHWW